MNRGSTAGAVRVIAAHAFSDGGASRIISSERVFGSVAIWELRAETAEFVVRPRPEHEDFFTFSFVDEGEVLSQHKDEPWVAIGSALVVAPYGIDRRLRFEGRCRMLAVRVPKSALVGFVTDLPSTPRVLPDQRVLDSALLAFLNAVTATNDAGSAIDRYAIEHLVLEMCGAILLDRLGTTWTKGHPNTALRDRALAVIAQQCEDPDLTSSRVASAVASSLRQLQAVFAEAGTTIAGEIRRHRARLAYSTLADSRFDVLTVEQIAQRSGFKNTMTLRRALSNVYGLSPTQVRHNRGVSR